MHCLCVNWVCTVIVRIERRRKVPLSFQCLALSEVALFPVWLEDDALICIFNGLGHLAELLEGR